MSDVLKRLLVELEAELKQQQLWSGKPPEHAAMASTLPFCCDTMRLEQWLQFIFLPRLQAMLKCGQALPTNISILPMAEEVFKPHGQRLQPLLQKIQLIDLTMSGGE
ncbi:hypothetical protein WG68_01630 [Arsukibacterium ikkense]|uniref:YqcC-like domain-containing protein n=1 Tax=Arsukibacterium ikkense TaxID=336831 RepID=A0A0M2VCY5_9GAMM|nr:YqcC family protein [Arsukibacterium ikkense]KKO47450.1 hypothetical protein WG68_01630 [Arsukibacterium ikkense]